ncbi:hypothetical protein [Streptomyces sp. LaPpAH-108]|uniref:hypothetical protein n=1 Tax=Streptomyces sp. LaPpAH-108 TaxID=1155714 RepID=UPI000368B00E|nr:hypothetical protein [Streptomyces sp. LaPpAH-108]
MTRDLHHVEIRPAEDGVTPLTEEEELRYRNLLFSELGHQISAHGWTRYPAHTPEDRRRLIAVAQRLTAHWGQEVCYEAEDPTRFRLYLRGFTG